MSGFDEIVVSLEALGETDIGEKIAAEAHPFIRDWLKAQAAHETSPDGTPWIPGKAGPVYQNAASRFTSASYGALIRITLSGPEVYGNFGGKHLPRRPMFPDSGGGTPDEIQTILEESAARIFRRVGV